MSSEQMVLKQVEVHYLGPGRSDRVIKHFVCKPPSILLGIKCLSCICMTLKNATSTSLYLMYHLLKRIYSTVNKQVLDSFAQGVKLI